MSSDGRDPWSLSVKRTDLAAVVIEVRQMSADVDLNSPSLMKSVYVKSKTKTSVSQENLLEQSSPLRSKS